MKKGRIIQALRIIVWVLIIGWMSIVACDFLRVKKDKQPIFCIHTDTISKRNENTYICTGIGYKYYNISTDSYLVKRFIPFWKSNDYEENN